MKPQISVIGNSDATPGQIELARSTGTLIVDHGGRIVCGGMGGVMEAVCEGARSSAHYCAGDTIGILPSSDFAAANTFVDICIPTGIGLARNAIVAAAGHAVVAIGGGGGTLSEMAFAWQLNRPLLALDCGEGWSAKLANQRLDDTHRPSIQGVGSPEELIGFLQALEILPP
ncbi:MAG: TIGR00725 family protein [Myxococcota bacterium]|nr:TIGR00725 family protein [Myxococcota bacterium]